MIFQNDPFTIVDKAFKALYPDKTYTVCWGEMSNGYGYTAIEETPPMIVLSTELPIKHAVEIFAHELAHVAEPQEGHSEKWEAAFYAIYKKYNDLIYGERN